MDYKHKEVNPMKETIRFEKNRTPAEAGARPTAMQLQHDDSLAFSAFVVICAFLALTVGVEGLLVWMGVLA